MGLIFPPAHRAVPILYILWLCGSLGSCSYLRGQSIGPAEWGIWYDDNSAKLMEGARLITTYKEVTDTQQEWMNAECINDFVGRPNAFLHKITFRKVDINPQWPYLLAGVEIHHSRDCKDEAPKRFAIELDRHSNNLQTAQGDQIWNSVLETSQPPERGISFGVPIRPENRIDVDEHLLAYMLRNSGQDVGRPQLFDIDGQTVVDDPERNLEVQPAAIEPLRGGPAQQNILDEVANMGFFDGGYQEVMEKLLESSSSESESDNDNSPERHQQMPENEDLQQLDQLLAPHAQPNIRETPADLQTDLQDDNYKVDDTSIVASKHLMEEESFSPLPTEKQYDMNDFFFPDIPVDFYDVYERDLYSEGYRFGEDTSIRIISHVGLKHPAVGNELNFQIPVQTE